MTMTILVPLDGSEFGEKILPTAVRLATETQSKVILLRVFAPVHDVARVNLASGPEGSVHSSAYAGVAPPGTNVTNVETATQAAARAESEALAYLRPLTQQFGGLQVECVARESGHPAEEIIRMAESHGADMIAMATHGRTGLAHVLLGSVAEAVVRASERPVVLVRSR